MATAMDQFIRTGPHSPRSALEYSQSQAKKDGGPAMATLPESYLRMPLVSTASFAEDVLHITKKRSATEYRDSYVSADLDLSSLSSFPSGSLPEVIPPATWDWGGALKTRLERKGQVGGATPMDGRSGPAWREQQRLITVGAPEELIRQLWACAATVRANFDWAPAVERYAGQPGI
ncbi:hypothetical protein P7C70_g364, partial [Phenoliferia sp. Uapishka_3]